MPEILSNAELAELRIAVLDLLPDRAEVYDHEDHRDGTGGTKRTYVKRAGTGEPPWEGDLLPCRVGQVKEALIVAYSSGRLNQIGQIGGKAIAQLTVPAETPVDPGDQLKVLGETYTVLSVLGPTTWELQRRLVCERG